MLRGDPNDGMEVDDPNMIRVRVENLKDLTKDGVTFEKRIDGFPWSFKVYRGEDKDIRGMITCDKSRESAVWVCDRVEGQVKLINLVDPSESIGRKFSSYLSYDYGDYIRHLYFGDSILMLKFDDSIGENFIRDESVVIEVKIAVKGANGDRFRKRRPIDFFSPSKYSDVALCVEGKKLYASKQILANASVYYEVLFFGDFKKSENNEIIIEDVSFEDLLTTLELIYDTGRKLNENNVDFILNVADRYQIQKVTFSVEEMLEDILPFELKLLLAYKYNLFDLQLYCMNKWYFRFIEEDKAEVLNSESYEHFSSVLKDQIREWESDSQARFSEKHKQYVIKEGILKKKQSERLEKMMPKPDLLSASRFSDVVLIVGEEKIYASKQILAYASSYFENLFYADTEKLCDNEFTIADVSSKELIVALEIIYDTHREIIDANNVESLLKIADRFKITSITDRAELWLNHSSANPFPNHKVLLLADQYKLETVKSYCLRRIDYCEEISEVKKSDSFSQYSRELSDKLFERMIELWEKEKARRG